MAIYLATIPVCVISGQTDSIESNIPQLDTKLQNLYRRN